MSVGERRGMGEVGAGTGLQVGCGQGNVAAHHGESTVAAHEGSAERVKVEPAALQKRRARVELKAPVSFSTTTTISERQQIVPTHILGLTITICPDNNIRENVLGE